MSEVFPATQLNKVRCLPERGLYDKALVFSILDEGYLCHVGFCTEGQSYVIPTLYARHGEDVYLHGSAASRMMRTLDAGVAVCITVTLLDGLALARSAFHHSINYRSVVVFGTAALISADKEKLEALQLLTNHVVPGRWEEVRQPTKQELKATSVLKVTIEQASAKVRSGPAIDDEDDYQLPVWAGVVPLRLEAEPPLPDSHNQHDIVAFDLQRLSSRSVVSNPKE